MLLVGTDVPESLAMPLPMVTGLHVDKASAGKLKCVKEFMIMPGPLRSTAGVSFVLFYLFKGYSSENEYGIKITCYIMSLNN